MIAHDDWKYPYLGLPSRQRRALVRVAEQLTSALLQYHNTIRAFHDEADCAPARGSKRVIVVAVGVVSQAGTWTTRLREAADRCC